LAAWHDWHELTQRVKTSHAARANQQAMADRIHRAHAARATSVRFDDEAPSTPTRSKPTPNYIKRGGLHGSRLASVDVARVEESDAHVSARGGERASSDSIIAFLDEIPPAKASCAKAPFVDAEHGKSHSPGSVFSTRPPHAVPWKLKGFGQPGRSNAAERPSAKA